MYSFLICIVALFLGYIFYGRFVERVFGIDNTRKTPAITKTDHVDYVPMRSWKVYMVQFLNIAGTGPIFGAIMGAKFGPSSYIWIVLGSIFAGAVHDFITGMLSIRQDGASLPDIVGEHVGNKARTAMLVISIILLMLVGAVFVYSPAEILGELLPLGFGPEDRSKAVMIWVIVVFLYYIIATMLPVDKVIGKIYPIFAFSLLFMAAGLFVGLLQRWPSIPEFWDGLANRGPSVGVNDQPIFPCIFITIACGAISGFHATQCPLMARCIKSERMARPVCYGAMITEGLVALIWAAVSSYFFFDGGAEELGSSLSAQAPTVVNVMARSWLGIAGGILAVFGVVAAPITSGDTAFRSARLTIADFLHLDQSSNRNRIRLCIPIFAAALLLLWFNIAKPDGFNIIWRYFGLANQALAAFTLWAITIYLFKQGKKYFITLIPAIFLTSVCATYIAIGKIGLNLPHSIIPYVAIVAAAVSAVLFICWARKQKKI